MGIADASNGSDSASAPRLQGISVVAAENIMVRNTTLSGTGAPWGTPPMSGNRTTISEIWAALL